MPASPVTNPVPSVSASATSLVLAPVTAGITGANRTKQIGRYQVTVIRDKCIAAASCVFIAPQVFEMDEENLARVISQDGNDDETKLLAAQSCPTMAIIVTDTTTGQQVWPITQ